MVVNTGMLLLKFQTAVNYTYLTDCPAEYAQCRSDARLGKENVIYEKFIMCELRAQYWYVWV